VAIRGILFDKDGTIIDYDRTWVPIHRDVALFAASGDKALAADLLRRFGQDPDTDAVTAGSVLAAGSIYDIAEAFAAHLGPRTPLDLAAAIDRIYAEGGARHAVLIDGAQATLIELKARGLRIGVATNDSVGGLEASLGCTGTLHLLDFAAGCDSGFGSKPDPGMALAFCEELRIAPSEMAMVGDAMHDLAMGRAAGAGMTIGVLSGTSVAEDLRALADVLLGSINDLLTLPELQR
jgi:phosphoglycolate phosphatase